MDKIEQMFQEKISKDFERLPDGKWQHTKGVRETFIIMGKNSPVQEYKERFPTAYNYALDKFFDEVHPY